MSFIEANVTIDLPDGVNPSDIVEEIRYIISAMNDKDTHINVVEVDDPVSSNPLHFVTH